MSSPPDGSAVPTNQIYNIAGNVRLLCTNMSHMHDTISRISEAIAKISENVERLSDRIVLVEKKVEYIHRELSTNHLVSLQTSRSGSARTKSLSRGVSLPQNIVDRRSLSKQSPFRKV